jgi:hypothetical protein
MIRSRIYIYKVGHVVHRNEVCIQDFDGKSRRKKSHKENLGRIILKWILEK